MAVIFNQEVKVKWNGNNQRHYADKGYSYKHNEEFTVPLKDVPINSKIKINVICDNCETLFLRTIIDAHMCKNHYCSKECRKFANNGKESPKDRLERSLEHLAILYKEIDRVPRVRDYDEIAKKHNLVRRRNLEEALNLPYGKICEMILGDTNKFIKDKDTLKKEFLELVKKLGRTPMAHELSENGLSQYKTYMRKFNMTYNEFVKSCDLEPNAEVFWKSDEELLNDFLTVYKELGRLPYFREFNMYENMCHGATYKKKFGSVENICKLLKIEYNQLPDDNSSAGTVCLDINNDPCKSLPEKIISDYLITNKVNFIKEYPYKNKISDVHYNTRFDWYLPDYDICIEYFGWFKEKYIGVDNWVGKYSDKTLNKIKLCSENNVRLIPLFPTDYEEGFKKFKSSFLTLVS